MVSINLNNNRELLFFKKQTFLGVGGVVRVFCELYA